MTLPKHDSWYGTTRPLFWPTSLYTSLIVSAQGFCKVAQMIIFIGKDSKKIEANTVNPFKYVSSKY